MQPSLIVVVTSWFSWIFFWLCRAFRPNFTDHMGTIIPQMHLGRHGFFRVIGGWGRGNNGFSFIKGMVGLSFQSLASMGGLHMQVVRGNLDNGVNRRRRRQGQIGPATMLGDCQVDNLLPSIIFRNLRLQWDVRRYRDIGGLQDLERRPFRPRLDHSLPNPVEKSRLK